MNHGDTHDTVIANHENNFEFFEFFEPLSQSDPALNRSCILSNTRQLRCRLRHNGSVLFGLKLAFVETKFPQKVQVKGITNRSLLAYMTARVKPQHFEKLIDADTLDYCHNINLLSDLKSCCYTTLSRVPVA